MILVHKHTGKPVEVGQKLIDFRGDEATVTGMEEPRHLGSTGRIHVWLPQGYHAAYYPNVYDCEWR
jgi:hypothetical protein